ncbi:MAG TPA: glycosyltransferase family 39 protein [Thermoleophilia bacterium]|nr:glycosyltransferase family 39 protein [Thermoleophilia bacterium]
MIARREVRPALRRHLVPILAVTAVAVAVRSTWVGFVHARPVSDYLFYYRSAAALASGHGYSILGHPTAFFPVGYPAFLAALFAVFGTRLGVVWVSGVVLWTVAAVLAYLLGVELHGRAVGVIAGLLVALAPDFVVFTGLAASESLFVPLLAIACLLLGLTPAARLGWRRAAAIGVLLGLAILVRSTAVLLPFVFGAGVVLLVRSRRSLLVAGVLLAATGLVLAPWIVRNRLVMGTATISTNGGYTLWMGLNPRATGGSTVRGVLPPWPIATVHSEVSQDAAYQRQAVHWALSHPGRALALVPRKLRFLLAWRDGPAVANFERPAGTDPFRYRAPRPLTAAEARIERAAAFEPVQSLLHDVFLIVGAAGIVLGVARRRPVAGWIATVTLFWIVFNATLIHGQTRFLTSVSPLLAPGVGLLAVTLVSLVASRLTGRVGQATQPATGPASPGGPPRLVSTGDEPRERSPEEETPHAPEPRPGRKEAA